MSVWYSDSIKEPDVRDWLYGEMAQARDCFLCGEVLSFPMIMWAGMTSSIYLHEECASQFVVRLARDCWELENNRSKGRIDVNGSIGGRRAS